MRFTDIFIVVFTLLIGLSDARPTPAEGKYYIVPKAHISAQLREDTSWNDGMF